MSGSHSCGEDRNLLALPGIKFLSLGRSAHSPSLYWFVILTYSFKTVYRTVKETCINLITAHFLSPFISHNNTYLSHTTWNPTLQQWTEIRSSECLPFIRLLCRTWYSSHTKITAGSKSRKHCGGINGTVKSITTLTTGFELEAGGGITASVPTKTLKT